MNKYPQNLIYPDSWGETVYRFVGYRLMRLCNHSPYDLKKPDERQEFLRVKARPVLDMAQSRLITKAKLSKLADNLDDLGKDNKFYDIPHIGGLAYLHWLWGVRAEAKLAWYNDRNGYVRRHHPDKLNEKMEARLNRLYQKSAFLTACQIEAGKRLQVLTRYAGPSLGDWAEATTKRRLVSLDPFQL